MDAIERGRSVSWGDGGKIRVTRGVRVEPSGQRVFGSIIAEFTPLALSALNLDVEGSGVERYSLCDERGETLLLAGPPAPMSDSPIGVSRCLCGP